MAVTYGFYNSLNSDRVYDAVQLSSIFDGVIRDGVFMYSNGDDLPFYPKVLPSVPMSITMDPGRCWFDHTWTLSDNLETFSFEPGEAYGRYDAVVLDVNRNVDARQNSFYVVKGEARPTPVWPTMINESERRQYPFIYVYIPASATSLRTQDIEYHVGRDPLDVPFVTCPLEILDPSDLFAKWDEIWAEWYSKVTTDWDAFVANRLQDFNQFITARQNEWDTFVSLRQDDWDAWLSARNVQYNNWFSQLQSDWTAWFDASKNDFDTFKGDYNKWWNDAETEFREWLAEIQGLINGDEFNELVQGINDVNGIFTATSSTVSGVTTVDIVIPTGGDELYKNIRKTATNTTYSFTFKSPVTYSPDQIYRFTDAINGINQQVFEVKDIQGRPLGMQGAWTSSSVVTMLRNGDTFHFVAADLVSSANVMGTHSESATYPVYKKFASIEYPTGTYANYNFVVPFQITPTYVPSSYSKQQSYGFLHIRTDGNSNVNAVETFISIDGGIDVTKEPGTSPNPAYQLVGTITSTNPATIELGGLFYKRYAGFIFTALNRGHRYGVSSLPIAIKTYQDISSNSTTYGPPTGTRVTSVYTGYDNKVDRLSPSYDISDSQVEVYTVASDGAAQTKERATSAIISGAIVKRAADGRFNVNPATTASHPVQYSQLTSAVQGALDVEEFYRFRRRSAGGGSTAHWVKLGTIHRPAVDSTAAFNVQVSFHISSSIIEVSNQTTQFANGNWTAEIQCSVRFLADGTVVPDGKTAIKCTSCTAPPNVWNPQGGIVLEFIANNTMNPIVWLRIPGNYSLLDVAVVHEFFNAEGTNTRTYELFKWGTPNTNSGSTIPQTSGSSLYDPILITPQVIGMPGFNGYNISNGWQVQNNWYFARENQTLATGCSLSWGVAASGVPNGGAVLHIRILKNTATASYTGTFTDTYSFPTSTSVQQRCALSPLAASSRADYWLFPFNTSNGPDAPTVYRDASWLRVHSSTALNADGSNAKAFMGGLTSIQLSIRLAISSSNTTGSSSHFTIPLETWYSAGKALGVF